MTRQEKVTIMSTCVIGFVTGVYLYFTGFTQMYVNPGGGNTAEQYETLAIVGEQYGGCERTGSCAAFQLLADGAYRYVEPGVAPVTGLIPRALRADVRTALTPAVLTSASQSATVGDCVSYVDGVDYRYEITLAGELYAVDTCTTALLATPELADTLDNLWNYFTTQY